MAKAKGKKLIETKQKKQPKQLVEPRKLDRPFVVSFKYKLEKNFKLGDLQRSNLQELQKFLDKVSDMTFQQVDRLYKRESDKGDEFNGQQMHHYKVTDSFRIHGILEEGRFKVIRLDPNHRVH